MRALLVQEQPDRDELLVAADIFEGQHGGRNKAAQLRDMYDNPDSWLFVEFNQDKLSEFPGALAYVKLRKWKLLVYQSLYTQRANEPAEQRRRNTGRTTRILQQVADWAENANAQGRSERVYVVGHSRAFAVGYMQPLFVSSIKWDYVMIHGMVRYGSVEVYFLGWDTYLRMVQQHDIRRGDEVFFDHHMPAIPEFRHNTTMRLSDTPPVQRFPE